MSAWVVTEGKTFGDLEKEKVIRPGVLLELDDGSHCLVGDINTIGGGCDDCPEVRRSDLIRRYRTVWEP